MALPTLIKSYQIDPNLIVPSQNDLTFYQAILLALKNSLTGFALNPWTVVASSDGTTADASDNWTVAGDVIWSAGAHAWIVLQRTDGAQMLLDCNYNSTQPEFMSIRFSPGGLFSGFASTSTAPTATDGEDMMSGDTIRWWGGQNSNPVTSRSVFHVWHSTDGLVTRIVNFIAGDVLTFVTIATLKDASPGHTDPIAYGWYAGTSERLSVPNLEDVGAAYTTHAGVKHRLHATGEGMSNLNLLEHVATGGTVDDITGELLLTDKKYAALTVGARGVRGGAFDLWWGSYQFAVSGDTFPNNPAAREIVMCGVLAFPWTGDGTICLTA